MCHCLSKKKHTAFPNEERMSFRSRAAQEADAADALPLCRDLLNASTVLDVVRPQTEENGLILAMEDEDVLSVCSRLSDAHVSSLPVFAEDGSCTGVVDFSDAVAYLLKMDWQSRGTLKHGTSVWEELGSVPIVDAIDLSERNPRVTIKASATLMEAVKLFDDQSLRRALVESDDEEGKIIGVLAPSALVRFLIQGLHGRVDTVLNRTLEDLDVGHGPVKSVRKDQTVIEAMHLMHLTRHSVAAVVDPATGALCGSISMSDIKLVFQEKRFSLLVSSCWKYIVEARERSDMEVFPFFGVSIEDKLQMVVSKLVATNVHHLYVVNADTQPERVISFTDVCSSLRREYAPSADEE